MTGAQNDFGYLAGQEFTIPFHEPSTEASCGFNEGGALNCYLNSGLTKEKLKKTGIKFTKTLEIVGNNIIQRRLQGQKYLTLSTESKTINCTGCQGDSILRGSDKSSGLSGGAIAEIVIVSAAVLIGGILAALLCRKTTTSTALYTTGT